MLDVAADSSMNVGAYTSAVANYVRLQAYEESRMVDLSPAIGYAQKGMAQVLVTGRDLDVQLLTLKADVGVIAPEDKAEMMRLKPENIADDGSAVCKETGVFIVPEGWKEGSIELD